MATNLDLDPELVEEAVAVGGRRTKKETVTEALREYIARRRQAQVTSLFGKVDYDSAHTLQEAASPQMKVLVDTSVWSLAFRRPARLQDPAVLELRSLVDQGRVAMIGAIRQELLSGIRTPESFERLRDHLQPFPDEKLEEADYERAAAHFNTCRAQGVQGSNTDFLLCAVAERRKMPIFTTDADFMRFAGILPITLHGRPAD